jgi:hypothetical protein
MTDVDPGRGEDQWLRSSRTSSSGNCVEVNFSHDVVAVRDSKHPEPILHLARAQWLVFLDAVKRGEFDR